MIINFVRKSVSARRKEVSDKFISEAIDLEKEDKYKRAAICYEQAALLIDSYEDRALVLYSSFVCYKMARDYRKAKIMVLSAAEMYKTAKQEEAADVCIFELDSLSCLNNTPSLRVNKGIKSVLRGCFMDSLFVG